MCTSCCGPTSTPIFGYYTFEQNERDNTLFSSIRSLFCSALPFIITTASTFVFLLTGHPLALVGAILGGIWLLASITYEDAHTRPHHRIQTVTQSIILPTVTPTPTHTHSHTTTYVVSPTPQPTVVMLPSPQPRPPQPRVFMQSPPSIIQPSLYVPPPPSHVQRAPISRVTNNLPRVEPVEVVSTGQLQRRASIGMRTHSSDNPTTRVAIAGAQIITQEQAQMRAPVGKREEEARAPTTLGGRAQLGRRNTPQ